MHPALKYDFKMLVDRLSDAISQKHVNVTRRGPLALYNYTQSCAYEKAWNDFTLSARGLILDMDMERIVALPFPKSSSTTVR